MILVRTNTIRVTMERQSLISLVSRFSSMVSLMYRVSRVHVS
jgi:hypothetical protein